MNDEQMQSIRNLIAIGQKVGHFEGSELYEAMYGLLVMNHRKVSYQLEDIEEHAWLVRAWLDEVEAISSSDETPEV